MTNVAAGELLTRNSRPGSYYTDHPEKSKRERSNLPESGASVTSLRLALGVYYAKMATSQRRKTLKHV